MKRILVLVLLLLMFSQINAFAYRKGSHPFLNSNYSPDAYGHLTRNDNLNRDTDGDGVVNYFDRNDRNSSRW